MKDLDVNQDWSIRAYKNGDEQAMFELYCAINGEVTDKVQWMRHWDWKYRQNPAGAPIIWLAESNGKIVGQYLINRVRMETGNEVITGSQSVETITHPDYRRQGIFEMLANRTYEEAKEKGIHIVYGFPNEYSYPVFIRKLGWFDVDALHAWLRPLNLENVLRRYTANQFLLKVGVATLNLAIKALYRTRKVPEVDGLTITRVSSFDERINDLWARVSSNYEIMVRRDEAYLNWRYVEVPNVSYAIYLAEKEGQILGYTVLKCKEQLGLTVGRIFELVVAGEKAIAQSLLLKAIEFFKEEKADIILYRLIGNKSLYGALRKSGFIYSRFASRKVRFIARSNTAQIPEAFIKEPSYWFVQTGDSDAI